MALATTSPILSQVSGNLGGINFRRVSGSTVVGRARSRPSTSTQAAQDGRLKLPEIFALWTGLDPWIKDQWRIYAQSHQRPDRCGNKRIRPAFEWFSAWYKYSLLTVAGQPDPHYEPPYDDRASFSCGSLSLTFHTTPSYLIETSAGLFPFGHSKLEIWTSRMLNAGQNYTKHWRFLGFKTYVAAEEDCTSLFTDLGFEFLEGEHIAVKCRWALFKHWPGPWSYATTTVVAP